MNNEQRRQWLLNDEGLYNLYIESGKSIKSFISQNKQIIDEVSGNVLAGKKQAHYLAYER